MEKPDFWPKCPDTIPERELWDIASETIWEAMQHYLEALERVEKAAKTIFDISKFPTDTTCPHGNLPKYPTHAWWCDSCWGNLEDALTAMGIEREIR